MAALPDPDPVPSVGYASGGTAADHRSARRRAALGRRAARSGSRSPCSPPAARSAPSCRPSARIPCTRASSTALDRLARRVRRRVVAGKSDRPRPLHALQRVHSRMSRSRRSTGATRSTSTAAATTARASPRAARSARSTSTRRGRARAERFDLVLDLHATPWITHAPAAAGLFRARRRSGRAGQGRRGARDADRRVREAEVLQLQGVDLRAQPLAAAGLHAVHRRLLGGGDSPRRRPASSSSRTCASAAAHARPCARRARSRYAYPSVPDLGARIRTLLSTYAKAGGRDACLLLHAEDGRDAIARFARRGKGLPARVIPVEVHHIASVGPRRLAGGARVGRVAGRRARDRRRGAAVSRGAGVPDAARRHDRQRARLPGRAFPDRRRRRRRGVRTRALAVAAGADRRACRDVRADAGEAHDARARARASRAARAGAAAA